MFEDLLDYLRKGQIKYTSTMSDLVLLTMDRVKIFVESCIRSGSAEYDAKLFEQLVAHIAKITPDNGAKHEKLLGDAVLLLDPSPGCGGRGRNWTARSRKPNLHAQ